MRAIPLLGALLIAGCATSPVPTEEARPVPPARLLTDLWSTPTPGSGALLVKRDSGFLGSGCAVRLSVDGTPVADLRTSEKVELNLPQGQHLLAAGGNKCIGLTSPIAEANVTIEPQRAVSYRISINGGLIIQPTAF